MSNQCALPELNDLAGAYCADRLSAAEQERFEVHLLECAACQEEVRLAAAVRVAARSRSWLLLRRIGLFGVPAAAAAAAALVVFARSPYRELGRIESPPEYEAMSVRAAAGPALAVDSGLAAYARAEYRQAEAQLSRAARDGGEPGSHFFLGAARLMLHRPAAAVAPLRNTIESGPNPYAPEARYYLAKAFLQLKRPDSAAAYLRQLREDTTATGRAAALLLEKLQLIER